MLARGSSFWGRDAAHCGLNPDVELTFVLARKIPLGEVSQRIDHLGGLNLNRQRLFVAELGNNSLGIVDLAATRIDFDALTTPRTRNSVC